MQIPIATHSSMFVIVVTMLLITGYTYLQEYLPHTAAWIVEQDRADFAGLGRLLLSYPELAADVCAGRELQTKRICRTFSDCTTGPRNGLRSGCYPLDPEYRERLEAAGLVVSGVSPDDQLVEMIEVADHPWFLGCQFHPEFKSKPMQPHPLFRDFISAALARKQQG